LVGAMYYDYKHPEHMREYSFVRNIRTIMWTSTALTQYKATQSNPDAHQKLAAWAGHIVWMNQGLYTLLAHHVVNDLTPLRLDDDCKTVIQEYIDKCNPDIPLATEAQEFFNTLSEETKIVE